MDEPWVGSTRLEAFQPFAAVAVDRTLWDGSYSRSDEATSDLPWRISRGAATLWVFTKPDQPPSHQQVLAFDEFLKHQAVFVPEIVSAVFNYYQQNVNTFRKSRSAGATDVLFPTLTAAEELRDLTELAEINVFAESGKPALAIGFVFQGTWTGEEGVGIRWRDGKVEEVGTRSVATPQ